MSWGGVIDTVIPSRYRDSLRPQTTQNLRKFSYTIERYCVPITLRAESNWLRSARPFFKPKVKSLTANPSIFMALSMESLGSINPAIAISFEVGADRASGISKMVATRYSIIHYRRIVPECPGSLAGGLASGMIGLGLRSSTRRLTSTICREVIGGSAPEPSAR
jgi:hypothetical protein